jgi:hypothetical protein
VIGALGIITDQIFRILKHVMLPWSEVR